MRKGKHNTNFSKVGVNGGQPIHAIAYTLSFAFLIVNLLCYLSESKSIPYIIEGMTNLINSLGGISLFLVHSTDAP